MLTYEQAEFKQQQGAAVEVKALATDDTCSLRRLLSHPEVNPHILFRSGPASQQASVDKLVQRMMYTYDPCALHAGIYLLGLPQLLGTVSLQNWNRREGTATLGYMLDPACWGCGLATEAVGLLLDYGVREAGVTRVEGRCRGDNTRSERVMIKNGMLLERQMPVVGSPGDVMKVYALVTQMK
ncbi:GNAT family N-acetyltransferase [Paenibacillus donghaensis]|uniref:GNAT family N-acetyltransferase n=1 Tax=Paenibacillus donghaensis TaxID=414771 RepID=UPI0012FD91E5|nr:GNAT family N-acetyltransferase [Paenibacillus donghaensis]